MMSEEKQFHEKMALLNNEFVNYLERMREATPHADFSPSLNSYLKHVADLDNMYGQKKNGSVIMEVNSSGVQTSMRNIFGSLTQMNNGGSQATSIFGNFAQSIDNGDSSTPLTPVFAGLSKSTNNGVGPSETLRFGIAQTNNDNGGDDEEQEEPPKPEEVEQTEKDAILSYKCGLHCLIDGAYEKLGNSYLSIKKPNDSQKQLVIRAATATGRLWTNTLVNDTLKWTKVADKKIRISYPRIVEVPKKDDKNDEEGAESGKEERTEIETMLLRMETTEELSKLIEELEKDTAAK